MNDSRTARRSLAKAMLGILALFMLLAIGTLLVPEDAPAVHVASGHVRS